MTAGRGSGVAPEVLASFYPRLYHVAHISCWRSVRQHGLLSTTGLLDLFEITGIQRRAIETLHRPESVKISHPVHGVAIVRDQKPMDDRGLRRALQDGLSASDWYQILNGKVFFWLAEDRLERFLYARAYRNERHLVLVVDTAKCLERCAGQVTLSPMNSGATKPFPHSRGLNTFLPLRDYPFDERHRRGLEPVVELAIEYGVPDIVNFLIRVEEAGAGRPASTVWRRQR